jgi:hypothetical protein
VLPYLKLGWDGHRRSRIVVANARRRTGAHSCSQGCGGGNVRVPSLEARDGGGRRTQRGAWRLVDDGPRRPSPCARGTRRPRPQFCWRTRLEFFISYEFTKIITANKFAKIALMCSDTIECKREKQNE